MFQMIDKIIDGISVALNNEFGDDYEIYTESIEQGLKEPCFSIVCINPKMEQFLGKRYFKQNRFCIHYFPETDTQNHESMAVIDRLFDCLEFITIDDDLYRGTKMTVEMVDGVVSFIVNYDIFVYKQRENTPGIETYSVSTDVKG